MKKTTKMFPLTRTSLVRSLSAFTAAILCGVVPAVKADTYWLRGPDSSQGAVRSLDKFADDTKMINGFHGSMGWALGDAENPTLPGTRVTSGSMAGHAFIIHEFDANGNFVEPPDYFPASGVNGEPTIASGTEQSVLQDRWPNRESEGYEKQGYVPKRFVARTPDATNASFPGEYLELRYGIVMHKKSNNIYTINDLRVTGWGVFVAGDSNNTASNSTTRFAGNYTVYPGAKFKIAIDSDNSNKSRNLCVLAAGHGSGLLVLGGDNNFVNVAQTLWMNGSLSDFTGPVHLVGHSKTTIQFAYDDSFPADPATPLDDGLIITNGVIAKFTGNVTIGPNRKVQLFANSDGVAPTIYVEAGKTVRIESEFSGTCGLNKTGNGTLIFAHPAFGDNPPTFTGATTISQNVLLEYAAQIEEWMKHLALVDATVAPQKRSAEVSVTVAHFGEGATGADVYFASGLSVDTLGDPVLVKSVSALNEAVTVQLPELQPDTTYYYAFFVTNNASPAEGVKVDGSFTTVPLDPPSIADVAVTAAARRADVNLNLVSVGEDADSAVVFVAYGTAANALTTTNVIDAAATPGAISYTIKNLADNKTYYCAITVVNDLGNSVTTSTFSFKTPSVSSIQRLWVGGGAAQADGSYRWDDYRNWANGVAPIANDKVYFPDGTEVTIEMPAAAFSSSGAFTISNNCDIVLKKSSEVDDDLVYKFTSNVTLPGTSSLTLSGSHVWFSNTGPANYKFEGNLTVTDGAYFQLSGELVISNNLITVEEQSKFGLPSKNITLAGETKFILDDSELLSEGGDRTITFKNDAQLVFCGKAPQASIIVTGGNNTTWNSHLVFCVPAGGYDRIPLKNLGGSPVPNTALLYCTVDSESPAYSSPMNKVVPLISTSKCIGYWSNKDTMRLDGLGECPAETMREWVYLTEQLTDENLTAGKYDSRDCWASVGGRSSFAENQLKTLGVYIQGPVSYPVFNLPTIVPDIHTAAVEVTLRTLGVDATSADVYVACGTDVDNLGDYTLVKEGAVLSDVIQTSLTGLDYDTDYYYVLLATNDLDPAQTGATTNRFTTLPAEVMAISGPTATGGKGVADFSVMVDKLGEGASSVEVSLIWGTSSSNLNNTNLISSAATLGEVDYRLYELPRTGTTYYYGFVATNGLGQTVVLATASMKFTTNGSETDCLWSGAGEPQADGSYRWDDYRNWANGAAPEHAKDRVYFPDGTDVTIEMPAMAYTTSGEFAISNNCNIVLKKSSEVDDDVLYKFTGKVTLPATSTLTLSGSHVWFSTTSLANYKLEGNLTLTDWAYFQLAGADNIVLSNNLITVEKKSKFALTSKNITLAGETQFILDDSELLSEGGSKTVTFRNTATLAFKGKAPYANVYVQGANVAGYEPHLIFNIPVGGYGRIPLVNSHGTAKMPSDNNPVFCTVDSDSPVFSQSIDKVVPLIVSTNYVNYSKSGNSKVTLDEVEVPPETEAAWVYLPDVMGDADLAGDICTSRESWSNAVPREAVTASGVGAVKTLGVYIKSGGEALLTLSGGTVTPEKTSSSVSVKVDRVGEGADAAEVSVIWGESADALVNTNVLAAAAVAGEVCSGTIDGLSADTTYSYAFTATNGIGQAVTTTPATFTTLALEVLTLANASARVQKTSAEVSVTVSRLGEGATGADVYFAYGSSANELGTPLLVKAGATANETVTAQVSDLMAGTTYYYEFTAQNNASPAQSADLAGNFKTVAPDTTKRTYTWTGGGDDDRWNNPANWSVDPTTGDFAGYPATETSDVIFPSGLVATVLVSRAEIAGSVNVKAANHVYIKGVSHDASITVKYFQFVDDPGSTTAGGTFDLVFDGLTVTETSPYGGADKNKKNHHHFGVGTSLTLTNGAVFNSLGNWSPNLANGTIRVEKGSAFNLDTRDDLDTSYKLWFGGDQSRIVIDESKVTVDGDLRLNDVTKSSDTQRGYYEFWGTNPVLRVEGKLYYGNNAGKIPTTLEFHLPSDGYFESPIQVVGSDPFPDTLTDASTPVTLSIIPADPDDPGSLILGSASLIDCPAGLRTADIHLSKETEKYCQLIFAGENAAGYPTMLRVVRRGSTYFLQ